MMFPKPNIRKSTRQKLSASIPESVLKRMCEQSLDLCNLTYIRLPSSILGAVFGPNSTMSINMKKFMSSIVKGVADLTVLGEDGRYISIELKTEIGKQSDAQKAWGRPLGEHYKIIRSFDDFKEAIDQWRMQQK